MSNAPQTNTPPERTETRLDKLVRKLAIHYEIYKGEEGINLAKFLHRIVKDENAATVYAYIGQASEIAKRVSKQRKLYKNLAYTDPLAILRTLADLREQNMPLVGDLRNGNGKMDGLRSRGIPELDQETILAAIIYPAFLLNRKAEPDKIDPKDKDATSINETLNREISDTFKNPTLARNLKRTTRDTLIVSELNPGGSVATAGSPEQEDKRIKDFLGIVSEYHPTPRAVLLRLARWSLFMDDLAQNPHQNGSAHKVLLAAELTEKVYIPLAAAARLKAYQDGDIHIAEMLNTIKTRLKNNRLKMLDSAAYDKARKTIVGLLADIAGKDAKYEVTDLKSGRAALKEVGTQLLGLLPDDLLQRCQVQMRIKDEASTNSELNKEGGIVNLKDPIGLRLIVTAPNISPTDTEEDIRKAEHIAVINAYKALKEAVRKLQSEGDYRFQFMGERPGEEKRMKDFYNRKFRDAFLSERNRDDNGYRAIHDTLLINCGGGKYVSIEIQIAGEKTNLNNEYGTAAHDKYKQFLNADAAGKPGGKTQKIAVADHDHMLFLIGRKGTAADFFAESLGRDPAKGYLAFCVENIEVERTLHHYKPELGLPEGKETPDNRNSPDRRALTTVLAAGDCVRYKTNAHLLNDAEHRQRMIDACAIPETRKILEDWDRQLTAAGPAYPGPRTPPNGSKLDHS